MRHVGHLPRSVVKFNTRAHNINTVVLTEMTTLVTFQLSENNACCQDKTNGVSVGQSQRITPHIHGLCRLRHTRIRGVSVYFSPEDRSSSSVWNVSSIYQTVPCQPKQTAVRIARAMNAWNLNGLNSVLYRTFYLCCRIVKHCSKIPSLLIHSLFNDAFSMHWLHTAKW